MQFILCYTCIIFKHTEINLTVLSILFSCKCKYYTSNCKYCSLIDKPLGMPADYDNAKRHSHYTCKKQTNVCYQAHMTAGKILIKSSSASLEEV